MRRLPPRSTRTDTLVAYTTLVRSTTGHGRGTDETCWRPAVRGRKAPSLSRGLGHQGVRQGAARGEPCARREIERRQLCRRDVGAGERPFRLAGPPRPHIGRASCRERVCTIVLI